ncbi:hypothetical protein FZO89_12295 [Luteimonas viscosa]|uniref:beta-galactosidase n=1 Tax=Luteimonas viscosa TaxID=1132694 RepID=A0A5D4XQQ2_9GAMM|nr:hypothetical protein [Luteimonas viscosa]TYT26976.1 hypothetical protein FZO89_12295 [Luteimonas viscosa]
MHGDGRVAIGAALMPLAASLPDPLRIGLAFRMPGDFNTLEWYGKGPHESYLDRQTGAALGRWTCAIADQHHDYMRPQETGNKVGVRWFAVRGQNLSTLTVRGEQPLSASVLAFRTNTWIVARRARHAAATSCRAAQRRVCGDRCRAEQRPRRHRQPEPAGATARALPQPGRVAAICVHAGGLAACARHPRRTRGNGHRQPSRRLTRGKGGSGRSRVRFAYPGYDAVAG